MEEMNLWSHDLLGKRSLRIVDKSKLQSDLAFPAISECDPTAVTHTASDVAIASELTPHQGPYRFPPAHEVSCLEDSIHLFHQTNCYQTIMIETCTLAAWLHFVRQFTLSSRLSATHLHCKNTSSLQKIKKSRPHHRHPAHHLHLESSIATVKY